MATDAASIGDQLHAAANSDSAEKAPVKRSWRRKFVKMRAKFEDTMHMSNQLIKDEYRAIALARRLQEQNDQILDFLLDINESTHIPPSLRYELRSSPNSPARETSPTPADRQLERKIQDLRADVVAKLITPEEFAERSASLTAAATAKPKRSFVALDSTVPHTTEAPDPLPEGLLIGDHCPGYMSPAHEDEYLLAVDTILESPSNSPTTGSRPFRLPPQQAVPSEKELTLRNPDSVYNWLRKNAPQVFLQDKDPNQPHENLSEKSAAPRAAPATGAASGRGAGKRHSTAALGTPGPKTEQDFLDDEIGFIPETGTHHTGRRSRANKDDDAYRPKGGSSRPGKRKRDDGETPTSGRGGRRKRGSAIGA